ncbi:ABC transporter permease [Collinsella sp. AGMB00827]|uniref:ABC transporter permease n=1 Tax=Collinsella ureilytica TaxID=2869515 RepID=A0ABS7MKC7_9ACTN|nr:ABC transporter permease [Collinsella urealyticum]
MSFIDLIREALRSLEANRGRSFLTILGIVIGIAAVIAMTSLIGGIQQSLLGSLGLNASRIINMSYAGPVSKTDLKRLGLALPEYERIEAGNFGGTNLKTKNKDVNVSMMGGSPSLFEMTGQAKIIAGRMFTESENETAARVIVLDRTGVRIAFGTSESEAVGKTLTLNGKSFTVIGVTENSAGMRPSEDFFQACIPFGTLDRYFKVGTGEIDHIVGLAREGVDVDELAEKTKEAFAKIKNLQTEEDKKLLYTSTMKSIIDMMNQFMSGFQLIMGAVAGISLLVGGIGIMNMMLTNVTERVREIGVRRALGATRRDITMQFLTESAVVCVTGGIIGMVFGYLISWGLAFAVNSAEQSSGFLGTGGATHIVPAMSVETVLFAVGVSVGIGLIFGIYPARRAAKLDPVEALRYQ